MSVWELDYEQRHRARAGYFILQLLVYRNILKYLEIPCLYHHFIARYIRNTFLEQQWVLKLPGLPFLNSYITILRALHPTAEGTWVCALSQGFGSQCASRRGKAASWASWGTLEVKIQLVQQAGSLAKCDTSEGRLCTGSSQGKASSSF